MRHNLLAIALISSIIFLEQNSIVFAGAITSKEEIAISTTGGGIKVKSNNGNTFAIGGRIHYDYDYFDGAYNADNDGNGGSESEFRRTRVNVTGTSGEDWGYKLAIDVNEGDAEIQTGFIEYKGFKHFNLLLGRLKSPIGLEELIGSNDLTSIERIITTEDFNLLAGIPSFQLQGQFHFNNLFAQIALMDEDFEDEDFADSYSTAIRVGGLIPLGEKHFIHAALSYADRDLGDNGFISFETEGGINALQGDIEIQSGNDFVFDDANQYGIELAYLNGPFSFQSEYFSADFDGASASADADPGDFDIENVDVDVDGWYGQVSYILTGESRGYKSQVGWFDKISPKSKLGAWELFAKYEDGEVDPDNQANESEYELLTLGVNWYATKNVRISLNYLDIDTDNFDSDSGASLDALGEEDGDAVSFRTQYAF